MAMHRISSSLPPLASLRAFEAVSRLGSVKMASEYLNVTPSAISHQLRALEAHVGLQLIEVKGRQVRLTNEGAIYAPPIIQAFSHLFRANELLEGLRKDPVVHVITTPTFAMLAALPHLEDFRKANPKLHLQLEARNTSLNADAELFDAAVCVGSPPFEGLTAYRLFNSRLVPLAHKKLWDRFAPIKAARDIARMPLIDFLGTQVVWHKWLREIDPISGTQKDEPYLVSDSLLTAIQMAESGMGVILAPLPLLIPRVVSGALCAPPIPSLDFGGGSDFYFVCGSAVQDSLKVKAVYKWLVDVAEKLELEAKRLGF